MLLFSFVITENAHKTSLWHKLNVEGIKMNIAFQICPL